MKTAISFRALKLLIVLMAGLFTVWVVSGCSDDDAMPQETYTINELNTSGISGTVTFTKVNSTTTRITVQLSGTTAGDLHPSHIHNGSVSSPGPIAISLEDINGTTGQSVTMVTELNNATPITYEELIAYNGYVNVHMSAANLATLLAQGNIGANK